MLRVGLTGGAASGKSTAAVIFRELGAFVSQSDEIARAMMQPGTALHQVFVERFGPAVLRSDGQLDRAILAKMAFHDGRVEELNALVHPPVIAAQQRWLQEIAAQYPDAVAIVESALLLETRHVPSGEAVAGATAGRSTDLEPPWRNRFDRIVLVTAPETVRVARYIARALASDSAADPALLREDARRRFAAQMPEEQKAALAHVVILNNGSGEELRARVQAVHRDLQTEARRTGNAPDAAIA